jgi:hypothetical protein
MKSGLKAIAPFVLSGLVMATVGTFNVNSSRASASGGGYGLLVGYVRPCGAKRFDAQPAEPLIMVLTRSNKTYETYNVSADPGTTSYHFDVPVGRYTLSTTWWGSKEYSVLIRFGTTTRLNFMVSCGAFST